MEKHWPAHEVVSELYGHEQTDTDSPLSGPAAEDAIHVDVATGEKAFAQLSRQLSVLTHNSRLSSGDATHKTNAHVDVEKTSSTDEDDRPFDLEDYLRNNKQLEDEAGIKSKKIGVLFEGLTVKGYGGSRIYAPTFPKAVIDFFNIYATAKSLLGLQSHGPMVDILKDFRGVAKPGEMVLVLGKPGSGCTSFLKVISNQREGYTSIDGRIAYGPFDAEEFGRRYRGEAVYNQEDDEHLATLTVGQTLGFALETKVPGKRPAGLSPAEFRERVLTMLLRMFRIEHCRNTVVGGPNVRGVSGGERKRVSIAETMITGASVIAYDNSTRGLDSSTALDYAKSLRLLTNIYHTTTFVSLYQASENIYEQFDKVMVIDQGRQLFYGPTKEARAYFEGLGFMEKPRMTTPDYLTGCTDPFEREYAPGRSEDDVPSTPDALVAAFNHSAQAKALDADIAAWNDRIEEEKHIYEDFQTSVRESKRKASPKSVYSAPFRSQVWMLMKRQFLLKIQARFTLCVSWFTSITIAIILGTVWLKLPKTSAGAFTRGGLLFISLLFNAFQAFAELGYTMLGRPIVNKHRAYTFYRPSALWIAQIAVDICFATVLITVFSLLVYFMCGLYLEAGAFFTFVLIIVSGYLGMTLFFRTVGVTCADFDSAIKIASFIITLLILTSGYLIQWREARVWLRWFYYISPLGLGFSALMENEFGHLDLTCTSESLIPSGPSYTNIDHQVCTLRGSVSGSDIVSGSAYIADTFNYRVDQLWRNWSIMLALIIFFLALNVFLGERLRFGAGGRTITFFTKENAEEKLLNAALMERRERRKKNKLEKTTTMVEIKSKAVLTWENLCYDVPVAGGQRRLLKDVFGYVKPGQLTALMGASGAGKTTLLDVLAARKNIGVIYGDVLVDGKKPGNAFQRGTAYAEQMDLHDHTQTVREALRFSADLRQPYEVPQEEKYAYVEEIITLLEMEDIADAIIGFPNAGLVVEQRKRVTIGVELAARPELLLFLDEPTSGLDSQSAYNIVRFLRKLADAGQAVLCTIHQPNASVLATFDRLLLLQKGETVYFGDIGEDASSLRSYFAKHGADLPHDANPAEWMLDAIGAGQTARIGDRDWADIWRTSDELKDVQDDIVRIKVDRSKDPTEVDDREYGTPLRHQIRVVNWRRQLAYYRSPSYGFTRLFNHVLIGVLSGLMFFQLGDSKTALQSRVFVIFQTTVLPALILAQVEPMYAQCRNLYYREAASKTYKQLAFVLSMLLAELPYSIISAICFFLPLYYLAGFQKAPNRAGYQFYMVLITELFSVTLGQMVAALTPSAFIAVLLNPFMIIIFALFCGVTISYPDIPKFWRAWLYQLNPITRLVGGMLVTELTGREVVCAASELNNFTAPAGESCGRYMQAFFDAGGAGYIVDNSTSDCAYCAYKSGEQFYEPLDYSFDNRWRDLGILTMFIGSNLIILLLASRYLNYNRR